MKMNVTKAFRLNKDDGTTQDFAVGLQDVPDEFADHWYVKAHAEALPTEEDKPAKGKKAATEEKPE